MRPECHDSDVRPVRRITVWSTTWRGIRERHARSMITGRSLGPTGA
jgi:hypothetical protein